MKEVLKITEVKNNRSVYSKGYSEAGASKVRRALKGFTAQSGSPIEDIDEHNYTLRQRGRMLYMAAPIATSAINTNRTSVVGTGLQMQSRIDREALGLTNEQAREWQKNTEREWKLWASKKQNCDASRMNNFSSLQQLVLISWLASGDVFALIRHEKPTSYCPYGLRLQLIEADRVSTPSNVKGIITPMSITTKKLDGGGKIFDGVEVDKNGAVVGYHICSQYPNEFNGDELKWAKVEAYGKKTGLPNILHVMSSERAGQYRGVTYLAPVIEEILQLRRYTEAELMAALIQCFFTAWITTKDANPAELPIGKVGTGDVGTGEDSIPHNEADEVSHDENEYEMGPGFVFHLKDKEDIKFGNPSIPTSGFDKFVESISLQIGAALEIPSEVLMKSFNSSYSASRAALLQAWEAFHMRRKWLVDDFCQPTYEIWLSEAVARGRINAPGFWADPAIRAAWCGTTWIGPTQGQLDPLKEAKAAVITVNNGFKTREQVTAEMDGGDWTQNVEQLRKENEMLHNARIYTPDNKDEGEGGQSE